MGYSEEACASIKEISQNIVAACPTLFHTSKRLWHMPRVWMTESQFRDALRASPELAVMSFFLQYHLQEAGEQAIRKTVIKNRRGFMSSHARTATKIAQYILGGEVPESPDGFKADGMRFADAMEYVAHVGARYAASTLATVQEVVEADDPPRPKFSLAALLDQE